MELLVLGPLELRREGIPVTVRRGRPRRLLLSLLLERGGPVAPGTLIDRLWTDELPVDAANALQVLVSYLRRTLAGTRLRIEHTPAGYRLAVPPHATAPDTVDLFRVERLVTAGRAPAAPPADRLRAATEALALWRGPALAEVAEEDFARGEVARAEELRLQAHEARAEALLALGRSDEALPDLGRLVREHPYRERLHGQLALALYRAGRQAEALAVLEAARATLVEELGLDPGPQLQELARRVLHQDPALDAPPAPPPAGPSRAEPPPAERTAPSPVPLPLTSLVGRDDEVPTLRRSLSRHRLVTLTGPGGAGKTRLAVEAVRAAERTVWWTDLADTPPGGAVAAVAAATGTGLTSTDDAVPELVRGIGGRDALLVLDTCEHRAGEVAALVRALTAGCPRLAVLATSRRPLGVPGELVRPVPPLPLPATGDADLPAVTASPAVRLYAERAAEARPGFVLDAGNARDVAAVCRLLDGLPLAIELAAAHAAALSPAKTAALLGDHVRLLGEGEGTGRHAGLRAVMDWSYGLLSDEEAAFLDRLSVFAGAFPLEAAVEVAGADLPADGLRLLLALVRQSLVTAAGEDHFRLLETVRTHAAGRLARDPAAAEASRDRHARWYAAFAEEADRSIRGADQAGWFADLRTAGPDLRAALRHALDGTPSRAGVGARLVCALSWYWSYEGTFAEARTWVAAARAAGPHGPRLDAWLRLAGGMHAESVGDLRTAERECRAAAAGFAAVGDVRGEARSLLHLGTAHWALGRPAEAAAAQDRSIALYRSVRSDSGAGLALVLRARTALDAGDSTGALELLVQARPVLDRAGDRHLVGLCLEQHARTCLAGDDLTAAGDLAGEALAVFEGTGYPEGVTAALQTLGRVALRRGDPGTAAERYRRAARTALDLDHRAALAESLDLLAEATLARGDARAAARLLGCAEEVREAAGLPRTPVQARWHDRWRPRLHAALGDACAAAVADGRRRRPEDLL
ncbi:Predicted ATPase [Geodermatophilus dictyosporus]|uniref:Predicted ATPase n=1 Tax=Geodermatophilus dictyosporus TaxID=1523247 RepID=A0A1I5NP21_9ACTN|nr:BTAD domain-containing putative transcriptional regulator [Geodermatophilus dictyosporus]SFP23400.1 Predicted ATPase [Geodermatophilus dictyosporus]